MKLKAVGLLKYPTSKQNALHGIENPALNWTQKSVKGENNRQGMSQHCIGAMMVHGPVNFQAA